MSKEMYIKAYDSVTENGVQLQASYCIEVYNQFKNKKEEIHSNIIKNILTLPLEIEFVFIPFIHMSFVYMIRYDIKNDRFDALEFTYVDYGKRPLIINNVLYAGIESKCLVWLTDIENIIN